jgi:hypothetical protein
LPAGLKGACQHEEADEQASAAPENQAFEDDAQEPLPEIPAQSLRKETAGLMKQAPAKAYAKANANDA